MEHTIYIQQYLTVKKHANVLINANSREEALKIFHEKYEDLDFEDLDFKIIKESIDDTEVF